MKSLFDRVPLVALVTDANENSEYVHYSGWDKNCPPPALPADVIARTRAKYLEGYERVTSSSRKPCRRLPLQVPG